MKSYCEENHKHKERFISASGDPIYGYLSHVKNVVMDETVLSDFHYPLVLENKRDIALLGFDFIDKCKREADAYGDIIITEFDDEGYSSADSALENDELFSLIDMLSVKTGHTVDALYHFIKIFIFSFYNYYPSGALSVSLRSLSLPPATLFILLPGSTRTGIVRIYLFLHCRLT